MRKFNYLSLILILTFLLAVPLNIDAKEKDKKGNKRSLAKTTQGPAQNVLNINNITSWIGSDGYHDWVVASSYNGAYPKGTGVGGVFAEGIAWGGRVNDGQTPLIRVNGNDYGSGCRSVFDEPRVYRVRPDFQTGSLADDAASFFDKSLGSVSEGDINTIKAQYEADWIEWPVDHGAPYLDADTNGVYEVDLDGDGIYGETGEDIPGIPAASQTVFIAYDDALSATLYQCPPIGLEVRETYWSYAYTGALANVIYKKVDLLYIGTPRTSPNATIEDFYFVQWCDPDVGSATDDFMGCDTSLNMGFAYNSRAQDATYGGIGLAPAAVGYDYLQGVSTRRDATPNDSAIFNLRWEKGRKYINAKPMSSAIYYAAGGTWGDPDYNYQGALEYYNYMQGLKPDGTPFPDEVRDEIPGVGTYLLAGDPVAGTGKLDGNIDTPGDRRLLVINGPIDINLGDTAEVVIALVGGLGGADNLENITNMKKNDATAQIVFDQLFKLPTMPPPDVTVAQLDNKIILDWGSNAALASKIENFSDQLYNFEGYEVYQLKTSSSTIANPDESVRLATFDLVNGITTILDTVEEAGVLLPVITAEGTDRGVQRYMEITRNFFRGNQPLKNGQEYYFAVVPYAFRPDPLLPFHALRSAVVTKVGVPQSPNPGTRYSATAGDTIPTTHATGGSDGSVTAIVVDPTRVTGNDYRVNFTDNAGNVTWSVTNTSTGNVGASDQTNQSGDETYPIVDGVMVKVLGPLPDFKDFLEVSNAAGPHEPTYASFTFNNSGFPSSFPVEPPTDRPTPNPAGESWGIQTGNVDDASFNYEWFKSRVLRGDNGSRLTPFDFELRFTAAGGKAYLAFTNEANVDVPFEIWNIGIATPDDPSDDYRMIPGVLDNLENNVFDLDGTDSPISGGDNDPETDWIYWYNPVNTAAGTAGYDAYVNALAAGDTAGALDQIGDEVMARMVLVNFNGGSISDPAFPANLGEIIPPTGTTFRFISTKPNTPNDAFTYTAPGTSTSADLAKEDVERINVFPNPYYGTHYRETSRDAKYVTFSHLPDKATIRIFDLAGVMVRTLQHNNSNPATSQRTTWDLKNNDNYPVASGIYIVHVDMPDLGVTKVLKLAVIQEQQILKVY